MDRIFQTWITHAAARGEAKCNSLEAANHESRKIIINLGETHLACTNTSNDQTKTVLNIKFSECFISSLDHADIEVEITTVMIATIAPIFPIPVLQSRYSGFVSHRQVAFRIERERRARTGEVQGASVGTI